MSLNNSLGKWNLARDRQIGLVPVGAMVLVTGSQMKSIFHIHLFFAPEVATSIVTGRKMKYVLQFYGYFRYFSDDYH